MMRVSNGTFICDFCGDIVIPTTLEPLTDAETVSVELDDNEQTSVVLNLAGGRELRHECTQVPADVLAQLRAM